MRVGILTSGGDCQALNATMRGLAKTLYQQKKDIEIIGFLDGYKGLMYENYRIMKPEDFEDILNLGGTILGTSRCPFKKMRVIENGFDKVAAMKKTYQKLKLDCLAILGGNGSLKTANLLSQEGLNVIGLPKTIDNDTWGTDYTFGFQSAIDIATRYLDEIQTTAASHSRVFVVEIMGHKVGHICLSAGIAAGADIILLPEIPYDIEVVAGEIEKKVKAAGERIVPKIADTIFENVKEIKGIKVAKVLFEKSNIPLMRDVIDTGREKLGSCIIVIGAQTDDDKAAIICGVSKDLTDKYNAGAIIKEIAAAAGGSGGGKADMAQAGTKHIDKLPEALDKIYDLI